MSENVCIFIQTKVNQGITKINIEAKEIQFEEIIFISSENKTENWDLIVTLDLRIN